VVEQVLANPAGRSVVPLEQFRQSAIGKKIAYQLGIAVTKARADEDQISEAVRGLRASHQSLSE
jgi:hypothetical protein